MKMLHSSLLTFACTGAFVFTFGLVEHIAESEADTAVRLDFPLYGTSTIIHGQVVTTGLKQVIGKELGAETAFAETLVSRKTQYAASLVKMRIAIVSFGLERCIKTDIECLRELEGILPLERAERVVEVCFSLRSIGGVPLLLHAEGKLWLPDTYLWSKG